MSEQHNPSHTCPAPWRTSQDRYSPCQTSVGEKCYPGVAWTSSGVPHLHFDQLILVPLIDVLKLCQIVLQRFHLVLERTKLSSDVSVLGTVWLTSGERKMVVKFDGPWTASLSPSASPRRTSDRTVFSLSQPVPCPLHRSLLAWCQSPWTTFALECSPGDLSWKRYFR